MTPLEQVFEHHLPELLARSKNLAQGSPVYGFSAVGPGPERGYWVLSLAERSCRRGRDDDRPDVRVEANAYALALLFAGGLDVTRALEEGVIRIEGDVQALERLAIFLRESRLTGR